MNELDLPLGLDASERDQAHNLAAVAILGLTAAAALAGGVAWYALRGEPQVLPAVHQISVPPLSVVPLDAPMLRPELRDDVATSQMAGSRSIIIVDGKTGRRETLLVGADDDVPVTGSVAVPR
ncbi:MAG TPA: hypothetical protein VLA00_02225 [Xanthobacteraceae bacterium]|nr:hypothetical protein [Xanthobacteraceae bacterium]